MPAFTFSPARPSRELLLSFLDYLQALLDELAGFQPPFALPEALERPILDEELQPMFVAAWESARPQMGLLRDRVVTAGDDALDRHGLQGPQLHFKLAGVSTRSVQLFANPIRRKLKRLLEMLDVLLESLLNALGVGSSLAELKSTLEKAIDD